MIRYALLVCALALAAGETCAGERSAALVEAFQADCVSELPNFTRIEAKAVAQNLPVNIDAGTPRQPEGPFNHIKSWMAGLASGTYELSAVEARGPAGEVASCAITAPDALGEDVKQDLMTTLNLAPPEREAVSPDGLRRSSAWRVKVQDQGVILLLIDGTPANGPGVYMNLTHRLVAGS
ncbi:MAG TPA: hypothetical protein VKB15_05850 [Xanthobacteraceae bacterium]|nr:hypothetical protein [Xanthobacteraceae bacterium]